MGKFLVIGCVLGVLAMDLTLVADPPPGRFAELEGTWTIAKMEIAGKSLLSEGETWKLIVKDGKAKTTAKNAPKEPVDISKFLDSSRKPKTITLPYEGTSLVFYGIYEVKGDELRVCGDGVEIAGEKNAEARRPREFDSNKGLLFVFKRESDRKE